MAKTEWKVNDEDEGMLPADDTWGELYIDGFYMGRYCYADMIGTMGGAVAIDPVYNLSTCFGTQHAMPDHGEGDELEKAKEWVRKTSLDEIRHLFQSRVYSEENPV